MGNHPLSFIFCDGEFGVSSPSDFGILRVMLEDVVLNANKKGVVIFFLHFGDGEFILSFWAGLGVLCMTMDWYFMFL